MWPLLYSALPSIDPGHELAEASDFMVGDAGEHVCEPGFGIDSVELRRFDQAIGEGSRLAAPVPLFEAGMVVGMHPAFESDQMVFGPFSLAIRGEPVQRCRRRVPSPGHRARG